MKPLEICGHIFFLGGEDMCIIDLRMLLYCPIIRLFFFSWNFTFAKVERCQITENCGINWEDSVIVESI